MRGSVVARTGLAVLTIALAVSACGGDDADSGAGQPTVASVPNGIDLADDGPRSASGRVTIEGFGETAVEVTTETGDFIEACLLLAQAAEQFSQGLMDVVDLGEYAGMLFDFPEETSGAFWMRDTPMPLSLAYLDDTGAIVSTADMEPCLDLGDQCPSYPPEGAYIRTLEVPQGQLEEIGLDGPEARLEVTGPCAPSG